RIGRQVGASAEVLSQQQIGVFVRAALPRTLRIAEVDLDVRGYREGLVLGHLQSAIPRQRASQGSHGENQWNPRFRLRSSDRILFASNQSLSTSASLAGERAAPAGAPGVSKQSAPPVSFQAHQNPRASQRTPSLQYFRKTLCTVRSILRRRSGLVCAA